MLQQHSLLSGTKYQLFQLMEILQPCVQSKIVKLSKQAKAKLEVNLFYTNENRKKGYCNQHSQRIMVQKRFWAQIQDTSSNKIVGNRFCSSNCRQRMEFLRQMLLLFHLEDGDRTLALRNAGKVVITFDLNPLSRTSQTARYNNCR